VILATLDQTVRGHDVRHSPGSDSASIPMFKVLSNDALGGGIGAGVLRPENVAGHFEVDNQRRSR
jgi:hypothetical protein